MAESLRDQLAANYDKIVTADAETAVEAPSTPAPTEPPSSRIVAAPKAAPAETQLDDRLRNADGTFKEKPKDSGAAVKGQHQPPTTPSGALAPAAVPALAKPRPARPSSWKKEFWPHWETLDPALAEYLNTRESQFASGVSTYKAEAESAKPMMEALAPFVPILQQHGIRPEQWITNLGHAHRTLALGSPMEKLQTFAKLAQEYGLPLQALYDQQAQQQYLAQPHYPPQQAQPQGNTLTREEAMKLFAEKFQEQHSMQEIARFSADGKHQHFDEVRDTMAGLLSANLADDLESAYQAALHHPKHADLMRAVQEQERATDEAKRREQEAARLAQAKGKAVSPRSATPTAQAGSETPKGLRSQLESAYDQHTGGRV